MPIFGAVRLRFGGELVQFRENVGVQTCPRFVGPCVLRHRADPAHRCGWIVWSGPAIVTRTHGDHDIDCHVCHAIQFSIHCAVLLLAAADLGVRVRLIMLSRTIVLAE